MVCSLISCMLLFFTMVMNSTLCHHDSFMLWFQSLDSSHYYYLLPLTCSENLSTLRMACYEERYFSPQASKISASPCCTNQSVTWMCRSNYLNLETFYHLMIASVRSSGFVWDCQSCYICAMPLEPPYP
jgi:membrane protein insertase Oxa1/YidC/SpoIIIJ